MAEIIIKLIFLLIMLIGVLGVFIPVIPGSPLVYAVLLIAKIFGYSEISWFWLLIFGFMTGIGLLMDYLIPVATTKKFGGSKYGIIGLIIGFILGIIFSPFGYFSIILAPFLGALAGELIHDRKNHKRALKAAGGSVVGFMISTFYGLLISLTMIAYYFFKDFL